MTVTIENWNTSDQLDNPNNFGYNDYVLTVDQQGLLPDDDANGVVSNASASLATEQQVQAELTRINGGSSGVIQSTDHIYRMVRDGRTFFVLRRSRFSDECRVAERPTNSLPISLMPERMQRALAFFGRTNGSGRFGDQWCRRGTETEGDIETPWDLSNAQGLTAIDNTIQIIRAAKSGTIPSFIPQSEQARAREIAAAVTEDDLNRLSQEISTRRQAVQSAADRWLNQSTFGKITDIGLAAVVFTVVGGLLHYFWNGTGGGKGPGDGGGGGGGRIWQIGLSGLIGRALAGNKATTKALPAPENVSQSVNAAESGSNAALWATAGGLFAIGLLGTFGFRGRAEVREGEVRTDEARTGEMSFREAAEVRLRELLFGEPVLQPAVAGPSGAALRSRGFLGSH